MADRFGTAPAYFVALLQEEWFSIFDHIRMFPKGSTDSSTKVLGFCLRTVQGTLRALRGTGCAFSAALGAAEHGMAWAMALALFKRALEERVSASGR